MLDNLNILYIEYMEMEISSETIELLEKVKSRPNNEIQIKNHFIFFKYLLWRYFLSSIDIQKDNKYIKPILWLPTKT